MNPQTSDTAILDWPILKLLAHFGMPRPAIHGPGGCFSGYVCSRAYHPFSERGQNVGYIPVLPAKADRMDFLRFVVRPDGVDEPIALLAEMLQHKNVAAVVSGENGICFEPASLANATALLHAAATWERMFTVVRDDRVPLASLAKEYAPA